MKKMIRIGFATQMIMMIAIFLLVIFSQPIPDLVAILFAGGMVMCIVCSFIARGQNSQKSL